MRVVELFASIQGEGIRQGKLETFIRLAGCNLSCSYCDTQYASSFNAGEEMSIADIASECKDIGLTHITITGGEPLANGKDIVSLIEKLISMYFRVSIETNGSFALPVLSKNGDLSYVMDWKCPSSGMTRFMNQDNLAKLTAWDSLKFVVGTEEDLEEVLRVIQSFEGRLYPSVFITPVYGKIELVQIAEFMLEHPRELYSATMQLQLHKQTWPIDMRGV